jgi:hypothetical protein
VLKVNGVDKAHEIAGRIVVEARLPQPGTPRSDSYEGDGHVIVRDPDTEVVKQALARIIETIQVSYA